MSIRAALEHAFGPNSVAPQRQDTSVMSGPGPDQLDPAVRALIVANADELTGLAGYRVVSGHFCLPNLLRLTAAGSIATVLREPRSRLLSAFAFWWLCQLNTEPGKEPPTELRALCSLDGFLASPMVARTIDNPLCRMLLFGDPRIPSDGFIAKPEEVAADALAALRTLGFVGIVELSEQMWQGLSAFFGVRLSPVTVNLTALESVGSYAPGLSTKISTETLTLIQARTAADRLVYRQALSDAGLPASEAGQLEQAAFATELVRFGDSTASYAAVGRDNIRTIKQLEARLRSVGQDLALVEAQLAQYRGRFDAIQRSASWRLTAPARAAKRLLPRSRRHRHLVA